MYLLVMIGPPPRICYRYLIVIHVVLLLLCIIFAITLIVLAFVPKGHETQVLIFQPDTVFIPLPPSSSLWKAVYLKTNATCKGTLYQPPCNQLQHSYNPNYLPSPLYSKFDHIYCLNNTVFTFNLKNSSPQTTIATEQVWVFTDYYQKIRYRNKMSNEKVNCSQKPKEAFCRELVNGTAKIVINNLPKNVGQYYYVLYNTVYVDFIISRYYYNSTDYSDYKIGEVNERTSFKVPLRDNFKPADIATPDVCLLFQVELCSPSYQYHYVYVTPEKRQDLLIWVGSISLLFLLISIILFVIQVIVYCVRKKLQQPDF